jgi:hypothetical protein
MNNNDKQTLLYTALEKAAEKLGDITPTVMEKYYQRYPEALPHFDRLGFGNLDRLERSMVDSALYCLMYWFERPDEIELVLQGAGTQHNDVKVPQALVVGLLDTTFDTIRSVIPDGDDATLRVCHELQSNLVELTEKYAAITVFPDS